MAADRAGSRGDAPPPAVAVLGRPELTLDIVWEAVSAAGMDLIDLREDGRMPANVVVLIDPTPADWEAAAALAEAIVVLSSHEIDGAALLDAIGRGAGAIVDLQWGLDGMIDTVRTVAAEGWALTPAQIQLLVPAVQEQARRHADRPPLSRREAEVLASIARGESLKQTARALGISVKTVENAQGRLYLKLGVRTRSQAVARAHEEGLLGVESPAD